MDEISSKRMKEAIQVVLWYSKCNLNLFELLLSWLKTFQTLIFLVDFIYMPVHLQKDLH